MTFSFHQDPYNLTMSRREARGIEASPHWSLAATGTTGIAASCNARGRAREDG
jgi:hypothetical protein